jgi:hypothetical protein
LVYDNVVRGVGKTFDDFAGPGSGTHTNIFYSDCFDGFCEDGLSTFTAYIYNNWIIDPLENATASIIYPNPGTSGVRDSVTYYLFNNVIGCDPAKGCVALQGASIDPYNAPSSLVMKVYDWNNTYQLAVSSGICVRVVPRTYPVAVVDVRNLHCIVPSNGIPVSFGPTLSKSSTSVLLQTVAEANLQGYTGPAWAPVDSLGATLTPGVELSQHCAGGLAPLCTDTTLGRTRTARTRHASDWQLGAYYRGLAAVGPSNLRLLSQ